MVTTKPLRIVLLEDAAADVVAARRMLKRLAPEATLEHFESSELLLGALEERSGGEWWPTLVVLDVNLPGRSGLHVLHWIKNHEHWGRVPVLVLSGSADESEVQKCYDHGAAGYLTKPIGADELETTWSAIVDYWSLTISSTAPNIRLAEG